MTQTYVLNLTEEQMQSLNLALCFATQLNKSEAERLRQLDNVSALYSRRAAMSNSIWDEVVGQATRQGFGFRNEESVTGMVSQ